jgi:hypothetical protein
LSYTVAIDDFIDKSVKKPEPRNQKSLGANQLAEKAGKQIPRRLKSLRNDKNKGLVPHG